MHSRPTGSCNHDTGTLVLGYNVGGQGEYNLTGGDLATDWERIGLEGMGTFNQSGTNGGGQLNPFTPQPPPDGGAPEPATLALLGLGLAGIGGLRRRR